MTQVVLGVATPHAPQLRLPIEGWYALREKDETDKRISYSALLANAKPNMDYELSDAVVRERYDTAQANLGLLRDKLAAVEWSKAAISAVIKETITAHGIKMPQLAHAVRVLVCGRAQTPSIDAVLELFPRNAVLARLQAA